MFHQEVTRLCVKYMTRKVTRKVTRKRAPAMTPNNGDCSSHKSDPSWRVTLVARTELHIAVILAIAVVFCIRHLFVGLWLATFGLWSLAVGL